MAREPQVIVFQEPVYKPLNTGRAATKERKKFLRGDVSEVFSSMATEQKRKSETISTFGLDLKATLQEVQSLASSVLVGKERRKFEEEQLKSLGAKAPKPEYVPYPHYQRVCNAKREKERRINEELRLTQMATGRQKKDWKLKFKGKGRWKEQIRSLEPAVGKFRGGVLKLTKQDLSNVKHKR